MSFADVRVRVIGGLVLLVSAWGGIVAFVGPSFGFDVRGTQSDWVWSQNHATLNLAPAVAGVCGGLMILVAASGAVARAGGALAFVAGVWFLVGPALEPLWNPAGVSTTGASTSLTMRALEQIGYYTGTGAAIVALATLALGLLIAARPAPAAAPASLSASGQTRMRFDSPSHA